eukprot:6192218-Pleurochrysis_carterae.AAC.4
MKLLAGDVTDSRLRVICALGSAARIQLLSSVECHENRPRRSAAQAVSHAWQTIGRSWSKIEVEMSWCALSANTTIDQVIQRILH